MSIPKPSSVSRGKLLTFGETRNLALAIGQKITEGELDDEGRILLNPIVQLLESMLGAPCALNHFNTHRKDTMEKLAGFYKKDLKDIYKAQGGRHNAGTW